ncbi:MAG TPA: tetratricopeptide repeat protein [Thermoanaerobaculia bacterium]|nr:tetratricopeptide repeat protein [Thermoanaerobaculia bacterium]
MSSRSTKPAFLAVLLLTAGVSLWAQGWAGRGRLQGLVKDQDGKPLAGARVTLRQGAPPVKAENPGPAPMTTDKIGKWSYLGLAGGAWGVLVEKEGYISSEGQVQVVEGGVGVATPIVVSLRPVPKEQVQKQQVETKGGQAVKLIDSGNTLLLQEKYAEARAEYEKALALLDPQYKPGVLRGIASTYYKEAAQAKDKQARAQKMDQAVGALKQALEIKPDDPESLQLISTLLVDAGRENEAKAYMARMPAGAKIDPDTLLNVGIRAYNEKKIDEALAEFSRVIEQNPQLAEAYYYRALTYLSKSRNKEAKADLQKLLELDPNNKFAAEAREFLKSL